MDAKHDKVLRALQKLPDNKKCFICESLVRVVGLGAQSPRAQRALIRLPFSPQGTTYVVPQYGTFICTSCSGRQ